MKNTLIALLVSLVAFSANAKDLGQRNIVDPLYYTGTESEKVLVIAGIERNMHYQYCVAIDMCTNSTLRMMEQQELDAFKYLLGIRDLTDNSKSLYKSIVNTYCVDIDMCTYGTIKMMYNQEVDKSNQKLKF
jgi:hypothetical protein